MRIDATVRRPVLVVVLALLVLGSPLLTSSAVAGTPTEDEAAFLKLINQERTSRGTGALVSDTKLAATARDWSGHMARSGTLDHDDGLASDASSVEPLWRAVAENVGYGGSVKQLHDAFMASSGHRANILNPRYNRVGIGVVHAGGWIWVTVRFLEGPTLAPPAPPPARPLAGDFDGDGHGDLLVYGPGSARDELWFGRADGTMHSVAMSVTGSYRPVVGDFDCDGRDEVFWYGPGSGADAVASWDGSAWRSRSVSVYGSYVPAGGDFDGDACDDVLWHAPGTAADAFWYGGADGGFRGQSAKVDGSYLPLAGDFDGRYGDDVFWYAPGSGADGIWYSTGVRGRSSIVATTVRSSYLPVIADFDGSGRDDIYWYAPGSAADGIWFGSSTQGHFGSQSQTVNGAYVPGATDVDGNHIADMVWFTPTSASGDAIWFGTSTTTLSFRSSTLRAG